MTPEQRILAKLGELALAFPNKDIPPESLAVYAKRLALLPVDAVCAAIDRLMDTARFFPTIGEIKEAAVTGPLGADLAEEAWAEVLREVKRVGFNRPPVFRDGRFEPPLVPEFSSPLIGAAAASIGWDVICTSDKPSIVMAQFKAAFTALRDRETAAKQTGARALDADALPAPKLVELKERAG